MFNRNIICIILLVVLAASKGIILLTKQLSSIFPEALPLRMRQSTQLICK
jgi:hypothetical protein